MESKGILGFSLHLRETSAQCVPSKGSGVGVMSYCNLRDSIVVTQCWRPECWSPEKSSREPASLITRPGVYLPSAELLLLDLLKENNCSCCLLGLLEGLNEMRHVQIACIRPEVGVQQTLIPSLFPDPAMTFSSASLRAVDIFSHIDS